VIYVINVTIQLYNILPSVKVLKADNADLWDGLVILLLELDLQVSEVELQVANALIHKGEYIIRVVLIIFFSCVLIIRNACEYDPVEILVLIETYVSKMWITRHTNRIIDTNK
jgi:hypothetical protein